MPKYHVQAECISYCYVIVEAESIDEANDKARKIDGAEFTDMEGSGGWTVLDSETVEYKEEETEC